MGWASLPRMSASSFPDYQNKDCPPPQVLQRKNQLYTCQAQKPAHDGVSSPFRPPSFCPSHTQEGSETG